MDEKGEDEEPTDESLLSAFASDLAKYGLKPVADGCPSQVPARPPDVTPSGDRSWRQTTYSSIVGDNKIPSISDVRVTSVRVEKGDTDDFPFEGNVAFTYTCRFKGDKCSPWSDRTVTRTYEFADRSKRWRCRARRR
jgi:hypothetical protein